MRFQLTSPVDPETAFARVADFAELESWDPFVRRSVLESGEPMTIGAVYRLESPVRLTLRYRIADIGSPHFVTYEGGTSRVHSTDRILVDPLHEGCRVTVTSEMRFNGRMKAVSPLIRTLVWLGGRFLSFPALRRHLAATR